MDVQPTRKLEKNVSTNDSDLINSIIKMYTQPWFIMIITQVYLSLNDLFEINMIHVWSDNKTGNVKVDRETEILNHAGSFYTIYKLLTILTWQNAIFHELDHYNFMKLFSHNF